MTGYGAARFEVDGVGFEVEARSTNHRYLDLRARLPRALAAFEGEVRARAQDRLARGKVELGVVPAGGAEALAELEIDLAVAARYVAAAETLRAAHRLAGELQVGELLALPGVARTAERRLPSEALAERMLRAVDAALDALVAMREAEGAALERDLRARLARVLDSARAIEARSGSVVESARERLRRRAEQLRDETGLLDAARLHQEVVLAADRLDVSEEIVRLRSHVEQFEKILSASGGSAGEGGVGRRLDFLLQELAREANTLGAKGGDSAIAHAVVELKTELERIREQVQNVE
jgi:uncharacterized protein (TIGR00255 family)